MRLAAPAAALLLPGSRAGLAPAGVPVRIAVPEPRARGVAAKVAGVPLDPSCVAVRS